MKIGDKVKKIKGNPLGKVGKIIFETTNIGPVRNSCNTEKQVKYFNIEAEDGTEFEASEDELEIVFS